MFDRSFTLLKLRPRNLCCYVTRKCCTIYDGKSSTSGYETNPRKVTIFTFPRDPSECTRWVNSLLNKLITDNQTNKSVTEKTKYLGICEKNWPELDRTITVNGSDKRSGDPHLPPPPPPQYLVHQFHLASNQYQYRTIS